MSVLILSIQRRAQGILVRTPLSFFVAPFAPLALIARATALLPRRELAAITLVRATAFALTLMAAAPNTQASPNDFGDTVVYGVHRALDLGGKGERPKTDYFINMGARSGILKGDVVEARRNAPSYDLLNRRVYKDMSYPIARMRIIHVERSMAVARLLRILPADETPSISPSAVMIGDSIRRLAPQEVKKELSLAKNIGKPKRSLASAKSVSTQGTNLSPKSPTPPGGAPLQGDKTVPSTNSPVQ